MTRTAVLLSTALLGFACGDKDDNTRAGGDSSDSTDGSDGTHGSDGGDGADGADGSGGGTGCADDPEEDGFCLHPNGVTVICPDAAVGASGVVDGTIYTKVDEDGLRGMDFDSSGWSTACTSGVTDLSQLFREATEFNQDIGSWDTSSVVDMSDLFRKAAAFNQDIGDWDVSNVMYMTSMFEAAGTFNQDLSAWCVQHIPSEPSFFAYNASAWTEPKPVWGSCPSR